MTFDYDMIVLGGGAAGLTASGMAASFGAKTLMIERDRLGGECTWSGCVPSKTLLHGAALAASAKGAAAYGVQMAVQVNFETLMQRVREVQKTIYERADHPRHFERLGIDVKRGVARFVDPHTVEVEGEAGCSRISGRYFVIATGSSPRVPEDVEGIRACGYLTSESIFGLQRLPNHLLVLGGGPVGVELAQAFRRLGSDVTLLHRGSTILERDDAELSEQVVGALREEGVRVHLRSSITRATRTGELIQLQTETGETYRGSHLLVAAGKTANVEGLALPQAGLAGNNFIKIDRRCRTEAQHIFAAGDVTQHLKLTHMAEQMSKVAVTNALLRIPLKLQTSRIPWCTFTDPELAQVGRTEPELRARGERFETHRFSYGSLDRATTDAAGVGLIKVSATRTGKIKGAAVLGARAGDLICEWALAMQKGVSLRVVSDAVHPYPTYGLGNRRAADLWYLRRRPHTLLRLVQLMLGYRGRLPSSEELETAIG